MRTSICGRNLPNLDGRVDSPEPGHRQVHDQDIGTRLCGERDGLVAVGGFGADLPPGNAFDQGP
jgi:hypothetical protein